ncbi:MAG TPA: glycerol-3-phosphate acyltransferase [Firmicutes bacterium]|nr:glycerol-3-phosphate acyltransferase [Bacillota bacterium]
MFWMLIKSYLMGSIPFAYIFAKFYRRKDIRRIGTGNVGTTNVLSHIGFMPGVLTAVTDGLKGVFAVMMGSAFGARGEFLALLLAIVGHNWPVWLRFHGGGGLATLIGGMLCISSWVVILIGLVVWGILYLIIREHNRSAIATCSFLPFLLGIFHSSWSHFCFGVGAAVVVGLKRFFCLKQDQKSLVA